MFVTATPEFGRALARLATTHPDSLGLAGPAEARASLAGQGESYAAWRLDLPPHALPEEVRAAGSEALVVRVPARPSESMPHAATLEFTALGLAPAGFGPVPVRLVDAADSPLGHALLVQSFVPGRVLPDSAWTDNVLTAHARQLASLHKRRYPGHGPVDAAEAELARELDPLAILEGAVAYWERVRPDLLRDSAAGRLTTAARALALEARPAFESVPYALLHGDTVAANILVDQGMPRYIDWEWSSIGDPARDLALIGAPEGASPWYITMDERREDLLLDAYLEAGGGGGADDLHRLRVRRRFHETIEQLFTAVHFLSRLQPVGRAVVVDGKIMEPGSEVPAVPVPDRQRPVYERAVAAMFRSVYARVGDGLGEPSIGT
ncbi:MAG TPA: phosphotransferase [Actinomycetales bacterium]|nr:phosphotransferase [Actinomycetales bacterium]